MRWLITLSCCWPAVILADVKHDCVAEYHLATKVAELRLNGMSIIDALEFIQPNKDGVRIVKSAYKDDRFLLDVDDRLLVEDFAGRVYLDCIELAQPKLVSHTRIIM